MKVLVTGGAGFIGRSLVRQLAEASHEVVALDNFSFSNEGQIESHPHVSWVHGDTRDFTQMQALVADSDVVAHLAAPSSFIMHEEDDLSACNFTMMGFKTVMEAMRKTGRKKIVWTSTSAVYEEWLKEPRVPFREDMPIDPPDSKAGCKHWCELEAQRYVNRYGFTSIAFRPFSVYGVGEHTKLGYANVSSLFAWAMMAGHRPIIWGDGRQTRDFIFVDDVARALKMAVEKEDLKSTVLNLGYGVEHTFLDVVRIVAEELGVPEPEPIWVEVPIQIYAHRLWADTEKIEKTLRFVPEVDLREGVRRIIAAARNLPPEARAQMQLDLQQHYFEKLPHVGEAIGKLQTA
jgi:UDP-glucose 4-epimerase